MDSIPLPALQTWFLPILLYIKTAKFRLVNLQSNSNIQICENPIESLVVLERKIDSLTKTLSKPMTT